MENKFESEYCRVEYIERDNIVFLVWKKFCSFENYRKPTMFAANLLKYYKNSNFIVDARNGFEDDAEDVEWGFSVLLPFMAESDCKKCIFIMNEVSNIDDEIDMWTKEFMKYFKVEKVLSYDEGIKLIEKN
ncbi:MAG: hypothetical protein ACRC2K_12535 [Clostridium sp.]